SFFQVTGSPEAPGHLVIALAGLSLAFQLPSMMIRSFLEGCQDFHLANAVDILVQILRTALTVIFLLAGFGLLTIAALFPATAIARLVGMWLVARWAAIPFRPNLREANLESLLQTRHFALLAFSLETLMRWFLQLDKFLAARLLSLPNLAILAVARRWPGALIDISVQPLNVTYPLISSAAARSDHRMIQKFLFLSVRNLLALALPLASALFVWAGVILRLWIGNEVLVGVPVFRVFVIFAILAILHDVPTTLLYGVGKIRFAAMLSGILLIAGIGAGAWACSWGGCWVWWQPIQLSKEWGHYCYIIMCYPWPRFVSVNGFVKQWPRRFGLLSLPLLGSHFPIGCCPRISPVLSFLSFQVSCCSSACSPESSQGRKSPIGIFTRLESC
ncbi:MAG: oligosaccharide flippase family protein, partial [Acidobacteria bacterium]|nr:oligosaccharide flippase family protein [Acidobacteriota bacterium]